MEPIVAVGADHLVAVEKLCHLESTLSRSVNLDDEVMACISKANVSFSHLSKRLQQDHEIRLRIKIAA